MTFLAMFTRTVTPCVFWTSFPVKRAISLSVCNGMESGIDNFKLVMRAVPQPVVVVTTAKFLPEKNTWLKRGVTCSSFTSISLKPPVISFAMNSPSRLHNLLTDTKRFAVHVLSKNQIQLAIHFSKPADDTQDQFESVPHEQTNDGIPLIRKCSAVLHCKSHSVNEIGDHYIWYGEVINSEVIDGSHEPLLYYLRAFHSIGDEAFMQAFEDRTLPFEEWTHEAHLRMAFNYIIEYGKDEATPRIRNGILRYNEVNKDKISRGYHETVTYFYIHMVDNAIKNMKNPNITFDEFIVSNNYLTEGSLLFKYYSFEAVNNTLAKSSYVPPDIQDLP